MLPLRFHHQKLYSVISYGDCHRTACNHSRVCQASLKAIKQAWPRLYRETIQPGLLLLHQAKATGDRFMQALDLLVPVRLKGYPSYTPGLSTWSSARGLTPALNFTDQLRGEKWDVGGETVISVPASYKFNY